MSQESGQLRVPGDHQVRFYGEDDELAKAVGTYLVEGLRSGAGGLVVATAPHRSAIEDALARAGVDVGLEQAAGRLLLADAAGQLDRFLAGDRLDHERFFAMASELIGRVAGGNGPSEGRPVRIYAEMVAVLWDAGRVPLAIELEGLWNGLGRRLPFSLFCGYPADVLARAGALGAADALAEQANLPAVQEVCRLHSHVAVTARDSRTFPYELDSVRAARHFVTGLLGMTYDDSVVDDAAIVTAELAANAVVHARSAFAVTVARSASSLTILVSDDMPVCGDGDGVPFSISQGHGLSVVTQLASRWGVERTPDGKRIWIELALPARRAVELAGADRRAF